MGVGELEGFIAVGVECVIISRTQINYEVLLRVRGKHLGDEVVEVAVGEGDRDGVGLLGLDAPAML